MTDLQRGDDGLQTPRDARLLFRVVLRGELLDISEIARRALVTVSSSAVMVLPATRAVAIQLPAAAFSNAIVGAEFRSILSTQISPNCKARASEDSKGTESSLSKCSAK